MLNDVSPVNIHSKGIPTERGIDGRPHGGVAEPKGARSNILGEHTYTPDRTSGRRGEASQSSEEAVEFNREETSLHRLYRSTRNTVEMTRGDKIAELREAVKAGDYRPNLMVVAERVLSIGEVGLI